MPDFSAFDASERIPRIGQFQYLQHLKGNWDAADVHVGVLPTGAGKSGISRAIQVATGADVITISNSLVTQYAADYPAVNFLKGKTHYHCRSGLTCKEWQQCGFDPCPSCPYQAARAAAREGFATFYNPMSYYYHRLQGGAGGDVVVVDEAHQLPGMVSMLSGKRLRQSDYKFSEKCTNEIYFVRWAKDQIRRLDSLASMYFGRKELEKLAKCKEEIETLSLICAGIEEDPQNYVFWIEKEKREVYLHVKPIFPPRFLMDRIVGGKKLVLMSGTLFEHDVRDIAGKRMVMTYEMPSPIPVKNREILYRPAPFAINWQTEPRRMADYILKHVELGKNTLIHSTYGWSKKLAPFFPPGTIYNTQEDKEEKIDEFKRRGGIFLASGCAEGLDFKGDICRLNMIPKLNFPDLKDPVVLKRKALQDGEKWYALTTAQQIIQQAGRSTRGADDFSKTLILDPNFGRLFTKYKKQLPNYFVEAVKMGVK